MQLSIISRSLPQACVLHTASITGLHAAETHSKERMKMKSICSRLTSSRLFALLFAVTTSLAQAAPNPLPSNSSAYGRGYAELSADWLEWVLAIPTGSNPLFDPDGVFAAVGQSGKVWFLVGTAGGSASRAVTVPAGTALFFPIVNYYWLNAPEYGDPPWSVAQERDVRDFLAAKIDTAQDLILEIDGRTAPKLNGLRVSGAVGECTLPDDNIFGLPFDPVPHECVADGYWVLLPPLSAGYHTIHFTGGIAADGFSLDVTYSVTVTAITSLARNQFRR
jgi:hypothetical protein